MALLLDPVPHTPRMKLVFTRCERHQLSDFDFFQAYGADWRVCVRVGRRHHAGFSDKGVHVIIGGDHVRRFDRAGNEPLVNPDQRVKILFHASPRKALVYAPYISMWGQVACFHHGGQQ